MTSSTPRPKSSRISHSLPLHFCLCLLLATPLAAQQGQSREGFREECTFFESLELGQFTAQSLKGIAIIGVDSATAEPLPNLQIAAVRTENEELSFAFTEKDGSFSVDDLEPGTYTVWTCLDGFDELTFDLVIDPDAEASELVVWVGLAEGGGRRAVELVGEDL